MSTDSKAVCGGGENQAARWLPIETAPTDRPVVVRMRTDRLSGGWFVATVTLPDPEDESRFAGSSTIWHYNGDILMSRFRGMWTHWLCDEPAALASTAGAGAGDWVTVPRTASKAMLDAAYAAHDAYEAVPEPKGWGGLGSVYKAMIEAAPAVPASPRSETFWDYTHALQGVIWRICNGHPITDDLIKQAPHAAGMAAKFMAASPPAPAEHGVGLDSLRAEMTKALDGHTRWSRDCNLTGEYLCGKVWPLVLSALSQGGGAGRSEGEGEEEAAGADNPWLPIELAPERTLVETMERTDAVVGTYQRIGKDWWARGLAYYVSRRLTHFRYLPAPAQSPSTSDAEG